MLPRIHFLVGLIVSSVLYFLFPSLSFLGLTLLFLASFLIDFDHYLFYVYKEKKFALRSAYFWFRGRASGLKDLSRKKKKEYHTGIYIFHGIELLIILILLGKLWFGFFFIALGVFLHLVLDWIEKIQHPAYPWKIFIIWDVIMYSRKKRV